VDALIGGFRSHPDSLGLQNLAECHRIHEEIIEKELATMPQAAGLKSFRALSSRAMSIPSLEKPWRKLVLGILPKLPGIDRAPVIRYRKNDWMMK
jgi:hypothetical protein